MLGPKCSDVLGNMFLETYHIKRQTIRENVKIKLLNQLITTHYNQLIEPDGMEKQKTECLLLELGSGIHVNHSTMKDVHNIHVKTFTFHNHAGKKEKPSEFTC